MAPMEDADAYRIAEADGWAPFTALADLSDAALERPVEGAHGWSGRDLIAHLTFWQEMGVRIARDLEPVDVGEDGDGWNERILAEWQVLPMAELRARFAAAPAALRAALDASPVSGWWGDEAIRLDLIGETADHYADHVADLEAILAAARG